MVCLADRPALPCITPVCPPGGACLRLRCLVAPERKDVQQPSQCSARAKFTLPAEASAVPQALDYATQLVALMDAIVAAARKQHDVTPLLEVSLVPFCSGSA